MEADSKPVKPGRAARTLAEEIAAAEVKLRGLRERKKDEDRREYERNQRAIYALLRDEGLDRIGCTQWQQALPKLRQLLGAAPAVPPAPIVRKKKAAAPLVAQPPVAAVPTTALFSSEAGASA